MSQKVGFPYFGLKLSVYIFFVGFILAIITFLINYPGIYVASLDPVIGIVKFLGVFLTGWALIAFAVNKELLKNQRLIAFAFAVIVLASLLSTGLGFAFLEMDV